MVILSDNSFRTAKEKGQALLIVVLVIVVTLTVGLSLASRSIIQLRNSTDEANSQAAFSAAEAGVEQAIKLGNVNGAGLISGINLNDKNNSQISNVDIVSIQSGQMLLENGLPLFQDNGADLWLSPYNADQTQLFQQPWGAGIPQTLTLYWGDSTTSNRCDDPALEILVISGTSRLNPSLGRWVYDPCGTNATSVPPNSRRNNNFPDAPQTGSFVVTGASKSITFHYEAQITITNGLLARIVPLYHPGAVGIAGNGLPEQGKIITSTGTAGVSNQEVVRKVTFFQGYEQLPIQFYFSMFTAK